MANCSLTGFLRSPNSIAIPHNLRCIPPYPFGNIATRCGLYETGAGCEFVSAPMRDDAREEITVIPYLCPEIVAALTEIFSPKPVKTRLPPRKDKMQMANMIREPLANEDQSEMFAMWFSRCRAVLHFTACRVLGGTEGADLAIHNCWIVASRDTPSFASESEFRSWLLRVLIDEALTIRRRVDCS